MIFWDWVGSPGDQKVILWFRDESPLAALMSAGGVCVVENTGSPGTLTFPGSLFCSKKIANGIAEIVSTAVSMASRILESPAPCADRRHVSDPLVNC